MSGLEERIVSLKFKDISQFKRDADTASTSIQNLNQSLDSAGGLKTGINTAMNSISSLTDKFKVLETIATGALLNIGAKLENMVSGAVKTLTVDNLSVGWDKYQQKVANVQTLMAQGISEEKVTEQLDKLMWYTDETSYSFSDMVNNIGKFTSRGVDLEDAATAMIGISNWAALSGQGVQGASRAMYNLSQAMGIGAVKLQDWRSISLASMDTVEFKKNVLDAAVALGTLTKAGDKFLTSEGTELTATLNFDTSLSEGWFTSEVLVQTLKKYGGYAEDIYSYVTENGGTAAEAMEALGDTTDALGQKAFKAAQEAITFKQALEATTEASQSAFSTSYELVFGTYTEAKVLWTDLANSLYSIFVDPLNEMNESLAAWKDASGRTELFEALYNVLGKISNIIGKLGIGNLFETLFPKSAEDIMWGITKAFQKFSEILTFSTPNLNEFKKNAFEGVDQLENSELTEAKNPLIKIINNFSQGIEGLRKGIEIIKNAISALIAKIKEFLGPIIPKLIEKASEIFKFLGEGFYTIVDKVSKWMQGVKMGEIDLTFFSNIWEFLKSIWEFLKTGVVDNLASQLKNIFGALGDVLNFDTINAGGVTVLVFAIKKVMDALNSILNGGIAEQLKGEKKLFGKDGLITDTIKRIKETIFGATDQIAENNKIDSLVNNIKVIAASVLMLAAAVLILAAVDSTKAMGAIAMIGLMMTMVVYLLKTLSAITNTTNKDGETGVSTKKMLGLLSVAAAMVVVVGAIAMLAGVVTILSFINQKKLLSAVGIVTMMLLIMGLFSVMASNMDVKDITKVASLGTAMITFGAAVGVFAMALSLLSLVNMTKVVENLFYALVASGIIALICMMLKKQTANMIAMSTALATFSVAIAALAVSLGLLKMIGSFDDIVLLMAGLSVALVAFAALSTFLQPSLLFMTELAGLISTISISALLLSAALIAVTTALSVLATMSVSTINSVLNIALYGFKSLIIGVAEIIGEAAPMLIDSLFVCIAQFLTTLAERVPQIGQALINIFYNVVKYICNNAAQLVKVLRLLLVTLGKILNELILVPLGDWIEDIFGSDWLSNIADDVTDFLNGRAEKIGLEPIEQEVVFDADTSKLEEKSEKTKKMYDDIKSGVKTRVTAGLAGVDTTSKETQAQLASIEKNTRQASNTQTEQNIDQSETTNVDNVFVYITSTNPDAKTITDAAVKGITQYTNRKAILSGKKTLKPVLK